MRALSLSASVPKDRLLYASFTIRNDASSVDRRMALQAVKHIGAAAGAFWHESPPK